MKINAKSIVLFYLILITSCTSDKRINGLTQYQGFDSVSDFAPELWIKDNTFKGSFSDDYKTFYFFRKIAPDIEKYVPYQSNFSVEKWMEPEIADYYDEKNSYTYQLKVPNTNELYFLSNKKTKADTSSTPNYNFWQTEIINDTYTKPKEFGHLDFIYNYNSQPCITKNGTIFFTSDLPDWSKTLSYKMEFLDGKYSKPELFEPVNRWRKNKNWIVYEFCVSPNQDYLIVCIQDKTKTSPSTDLYISYFNDNIWTNPKRLDNRINSAKGENFPTITNDGEYLVFTRAFSKYKIVSTKAFKQKE